MSKYCVCFNACCGVRLVVHLFAFVVFLFYFAFAGWKIPRIFCIALWNLILKNVLLDRCVDDTWVFERVFRDCFYFIWPLALAMSLVTITKLISCMHCKLNCQKINLWQKLNVVTKQQRKKMENKISTTLATHQFQWKISTVFLSLIKTSIKYTLNFKQCRTNMECPTQYGKRQRFLRAHKREF